MELFRNTSVILTAMPHKRFAAFFVLALFALPSLAAITGSVMTPDGKPVAGARVSTFAPESSEARRTRLLSEHPEAVPLASTQTDAKGAFSLESPKVPVVDLGVSLRGYEPASRTIERDEDSIAIVTPKVETRTGSVTAGGKPVVGASVILMYGGAEHFAKTNGEGRYDAPNPKRLSRITIVHPDFPIVDDFFFGLSETAMRGKLNQTLTKGTPLTGRVLASDGKTAVAGAAILLNAWPLATSGEDGAFTIERAPAKWELLVARKDTQLAHRAFAKNASLTLKLEKGALFTGRVLDAKSKLPVPGTTVRLGARRFDVRSDLSVWAEVDAKGTYSFLAPAGSYALTVSHPAYDNEMADAAAAAGQRSSRDFSLQPLARVTGVVLDEANKPVPAATLSPEQQGDPFSMRGGRMMMRDSATSTSGPDGKFLLRMNGDRELKIRASKKGLPSGRTDTLKLAPGERKGGVVIALPSGIEVTGTISDAEGNPLSGALVSAAETQGRGGGNMQRMMISIGGPQRDDEAVQTASDGSFSMRLKEAAYDFTARRDGYASKTIRAHSVTPGGTLPVDVKLDPAVEITGRVVRGGTGIDDVQIYVMSGGSDQSNATTGPDGSFTLANLTPGQVAAFVTKPSDFISEQRMFTAPGRDVVIELPPGGRVSGRVVEKGTRRPVTSFDAGITRSRGGGPMVMMGPPQVQPFTSDDGSFVLENVPAGSATLVANAPGFVSGRLNLTVEEGKSIDDLVVELDTGVKLTGKVTGPNGAALPDVTVRLAPSATGGFALSGADKRATTDANGEYTLDALNTGEETISFSHTRYLATSKQVTLKGREMRLDVQLDGGTSLTGLVVTEAGVPVADASVRVNASGGMPQSVQTNANGVFEFESLAPGRYRFTASRSGYAEGVVEDFDIATGGQLRIVLKTGGTLYGRVTGLPDQDLANTFVTARVGNSLSQTPVDGSGSYRLEGAPVGNVQVSAGVRGMTGSRSTASQTVTVAAGSSVQVDLAFRSDVVVHGRVTRNGTALSNAQLLFMARGGGSSSTSNATTDAQGNYSLTGLEDGNYIVTVIEMQRLSTYTTNYEVRGSSTFDIDYTTAGMRGRVVDLANNRPLSGANVTVRAISTVEVFRGRGAVTDENGVFAIDSVPAGSYTVTASLDEYGSDSKEVVVGESSIDNIELRLAQGDGITLKVVDARDGRALRASATLYDAQGRIVQERGGQFIFGVDPAANSLQIPIAPGSYVATVSAQDYAPVHVSVSSPSTRTIALTRGGRIELDSKHSEKRRVQLIDSFNLIYPRMGVVPRRYDLLPRTSTPLERIAPGRYTLQLLGPDELTVVDQVPVIVNEGQTTKIEI